MYLGYYRAKQALNLILGFSEVNFVDRAKRLFHAQIFGS